MTSTAHNEHTSGCEKLTPEAVQQLDAIARDDQAVHGLWQAFGYALADVNNQFREAGTLCTETFESRVLHLLQLVRLVGVLASPVVTGRQPHIRLGPDPRPTHAPSGSATTPTSN